jgi:DNA-binding transcriptional ArsR family regulator
VSYQAMNWAVRQTTGSPTAKLVLLCLANYAGPDGRCYPTQATIARECELSERSVRQWLAALENAGLMAREKRRRLDGTQLADAIRLLIDRPEPAAACMEHSGGDSRNDVPPEDADAASECGRQDVPPVSLDGGRQDILPADGRHDVPPDGDSRNDVPPIRRNLAPEQAAPRSAKPLRRSVKITNTAHVSAREGDFSSPSGRTALDALQARLEEACGEALADKAVAPGLMSLAMPKSWLDAGCDLDLDVLPTLRARCLGRAPRAIRAWSYFAVAVFEAREKRLALVSPSGAPRRTSHPLGGGPTEPAPAGGRQLRGGAADGDFETFWSAWKPGKLESRKAAEQAWNMLSGADRAAALAAARPYAAEVERERSRRCHARTFLADRIFANFEGEAESLPVIRPGTPQWEAWAAHEAAGGGRWTARFARGQPITVPTEWPPSYAPSGPPARTAHPRGGASTTSAGSVSTPVAGGDFAPEARPAD